MHRTGLAVVHLVREPAIGLDPSGHQADPDMVVVLVGPIEQAAAEAPGVPDAAEAPGELGLVFEGLEVALGERVGFL